MDIAERNSLLITCGCERVNNCLDKTEATFGACSCRIITKAWILQVLLGFHCSMKCDSKVTTHSNRMLQPECLVTTR